MCASIEQPETFHQALVARELEGTEFVEEQQWCALQPAQDLIGPFEGIRFEAPVISVRTHAIRRSGVSQRSSFTRGEVNDVDADFPSGLEPTR
jgi:hypothetical protein